MVDKPEPFSSPMAWWGPIQGAVSGHATTEQVWEAIHAHTQANGLVEPPNLWGVVNEVRSQAANLRNASDRLTGASPSDAITGAYLAPLPYGAIGGAGAGPRTFDVRVGYTAIRTGVPEEDYVTLRYTGGLPATVGELRDEAALVTEGLVEGYGAALVSIGAIQIGEL